MNGMRKAIGLLMVIAFTAFALPSVAGNDKKMYSLQMSVPPGQTTAPFTVKAKITNEGNSSIHSFNLFVAGVTVVGVDRLDDASVVFIGSAITVTKADDLESGESRTVTIHVNSCGDGQWSAAAWTGAKLNGQQFNLVLADSNLSSPIPCGPPLAAGGVFTVPNSTDLCLVFGQRGYYDKDGSIPGTGLPIFVTNNQPTLHFRWNDFQPGGDPLATFEYTACGPGTASLPKVAWLNTDGTPASTSGTPAYIAGQWCLDPMILPAPYGTLSAGVGTADGYIAVNTTTPPPQSPSGTPPGSIPYPGSGPTNPATPGTAFDVVIGTERITVQLVCLDNDGDPSDSGDCTDIAGGEGKALKVVTRGVGGTSVTTHPSGALAMSTPLPLLPLTAAFPYVAGRQALMCIAARSGFSNTFIDIGGDGWSEP